MGPLAKTLTDPVKDLRRIPASDIKRRGWRGVMRSLGAEKGLVITNHDRPEAVILPAHEYAKLLDKVRQAESRTESDLALLRRRFDDRLAALRAPDAGDRLRSVMSRPARLRGKVRAGKTY